MAVSAPSLTQTAARAAQAGVALFKVGQVLEALVLGRTGAGLTELKIGDVLVQAQLPPNVLPGTVLQLAVKIGGTTPQLAILTQSAGGGGPVVTSAVTVLPLPAAPVVLLPAGADGVAKAQAPQVVVATGSPSESAVPAAVQASSGLAQPAAQVPLQPVSAGAPQAATTPPQATAAVVAPVAQQAEALAVTTAALPTPTSQGAVQSQGVMVAVPALAVSLAADPAANSALPVTTSSPATGVLSPEPVATPAPLVLAPSGQPAPQPTAGSREVIATPSPVLAAAVQAVIAPMPTEAPLVQAAAGAGPSPNTAPQTPPTPGAEPEAANPLLVAQSATRTLQTVAELPRVAVPPASIAQAAASLPMTPEAALAQMIPDALAKQDTAGPLMASLARVVAGAVPLPAPALRAAAQVLGQRVVVTDGEIGGEALEQAVAKAGVMLEATLAKGTSPPGDAKAGLLALKSALTAMLGGNPPSAPAGAQHASPPPLRGMPMRAAPIDIPPLPEGVRDIARTLHAQTDAAISRTKLLQLASLPDADSRVAPRSETRVEIPFLIGQELVMVQIQISRDGARREAEQRKRGWTMRFAMNFSQTGEVGAEVGLLGKAVNVALWAAEPETAQALNNMLPELGRALERLGLNPGTIRSRAGAPEPVKLRSGHLLDAMS